MHAAVSTFPVKPGKLDELVQRAQEFLPRTVPGLKSVYFLANREKNELLAIALYETEADAIAFATAGTPVEREEAMEKMSQLVTGQGDRNLYEVATVL